MDLSKFHVVAVVSNPIRYQSRYALYDSFSADVVRKGAQLWTLEMQTGRRAPRITDVTKEKELQLFASGLDGLPWLKECLQNILVQHMTSAYPDWRGIIFTDADVKYEQNWVEETAHALQLHPVVQPWSHSVDMGPGGGATSDKMQLSYAYCYGNDIEVQGSSPYVAGGHPGYSIAFRREAFNHLGGLIDIGVAGSGDRHMMTALVGRVGQSFHPNVSENYKRVLYQWQERAERYVKRNLGYVPMLARHMFHGSKKHRKYGERWKILTNYKYDPFTDLKRDSSGIYQLVVECERQRKLRDALHKYMKGRQEDSNSL